ncbi:pyruvate ferredoxin oxidoreductase, partial [Candidatus Calescamantes bacterium]|nr:pyruvate ferredoxin oxidoreductase [Candidatus Calescamantes bacterium]
MGKYIALTGAESAAFAMKQINPDVVAAYPITPQTPVAMKFSEYVANGEVNTEYVTVESEHSAMSATVGAAAAGARAMTATASNGLALMWEIVYIASSMRLPILMAVVNRALSGPINIHGDHSDAMGARDSGWIQIFNENNQEVYDSFIMALRIAEHPDVLTPAMVCQDGFITSHSVENVMPLTNEQV